MKKIVNTSQKLPIKIIQKQRHIAYHMLDNTFNDFYRTA